MIASRKITDLLAFVAAKCQAFVTACQNAGIDVLITSTYRDGESQHELWREGREIPGEPCHCGGVELSIGLCPNHPFGLRVTNADAGDSFHQYRVAFDFVPLVNGKPVWNKAALFEQCGKIAESLGLVWAGRWVRFPEKAHCQYASGLTLADFKAGKTIKEEEQR